MSDADVRKLIQRLAARLDRIEKMLLIEPGRDAPAPAPAPAAASKPAPPMRPPTVPPVAAPVVPPARRRSPAPPVRVPASPPKPRTALEVRIGQNWSAWVGGGVIVLAVIFAVMVGYDAGLWGKMPPVLRLMAIAGFGALLVAAGEFALRRVGVAASVGLFGAGLGTLYVDAYAAFEWFTPAVVSREWSFALMAAVAVLGFGITLRSGFATIGIISIVGGYLTPWLLGTRGEYTVEIGSFLSMLLGVSLALSTVRPKSFRVLRYVAVGGTAVTGLAWLDGALGSNWMAALLLPTVWWAMVVTEAVVAALRRQSPNGNVVITLLATAWFVTLGCWVLRETQPAGLDWLGIFTTLVGAVAAAVALHFGPAVSAFARGPTCAMDRLAVALWAQAAVLMAVAVALQFDGYGQSIGWMAISLAAFEIGRRLRLRAVDVFGFVVGALALLRVAVFDAGLGTLGGTVFVVGDVTVTGWSILAMMTVLATHVAARRLGAAWRMAPVVLAALGTLGWLALCEEATTGPATTAGWLLGGSVLIALERFGRRQGYLEIGQVILTFATAGWLLDAAVHRAAGAAGVTGYLPVLNWQMAQVAGIVVVGWWSSRVLARRRQLAATGGDASGSAAWQVALIVGAVVLLVGFSFEVDRAIAQYEATRPDAWTPAWHPLHLRGLWCTLLWAAGGLAMIAWTRVRPTRLMLTAGWYVLVAATIFWLSVDTVSWRLLDGLSSSRIVLNVQFLVGAATGLMVAAAIALLRRTPVPVSGAVGLGFVLIGLIGLWLGTLEIDRFFDPRTGRLGQNTEMARQTGWSVYWGVFAITVVALGFAKRSAGCRYAGLALLAITVVKVLTIDMSEVSNVFRVLSFLVVGLLLVGTSVGYAKLAPRLEKGYVTGGDDGRPEQ